jgi:hypothetical protein
LASIAHIRLQPPLASCPLLADIVAKRFSASVREKIFQIWPSTRIFDSTNRLSRVEYCANLLSGRRSRTFATISAQRVG